jgi:hypothetical protein
MRCGWGTVTGFGASPIVVVIVAGASKLAPLFENGRKVNQMVNTSKKLQEAKKAKRDEFYTQLTDIEKELKHYRDQFAGKTIYCNCDDPESSNFFVYFVLNFNFLKLKKLITTHYVSESSPSNESYSLTVTPENIDTVLVNNADIDYDALKVLREPLTGNGDFRSDVCVEFLKESDIVVTNPPFSLFREYVAQLFEYGKQFIVLGNANSITYKEIFSLIQSNDLWLGYNNGGDKWFTVPDGYQFNDSASVRMGADGHQQFKMRNIDWFTNMDTNKRHETLDLFRRYKGHESDYPHYDNYDAIEVSKVVNIPEDYDGVMGVPITFIDKYNPDQFEIVDQVNGGAKAHTVMGTVLFNPPLKVGYVTSIGGRAKYARVLIRKR